jgi:hypothetical protein
MVPVGQRKLYLRLLEQRCQTRQPVLMSANKPATKRPFLSVQSKSVFGIEPCGLAPATANACVCSSLAIMGGSSVETLLTEAAPDTVRCSRSTSLPVGAAEKGQPAGLPCDRLSAEPPLVRPNDEPPEDERGLMLLSEAERPSFALIWLAFWMVSVGDLNELACWCCLTYFRLFSSIWSRCCCCCGDCFGPSPLISRAGDMSASTPVVVWPAVSAWSSPRRREKISLLVDESCSAELDDRRVVPRGGRCSDEMQLG